MELAGRVSSEGDRFPDFRCARHENVARFFIYALRVLFVMQPDVLRATDAVTVPKYA
jgi:hypothetical protein